MLHRYKSIFFCTLIVVLLVSFGAFAERWHGIYDFRYGQSFVYELEHVRNRTTRTTGRLYLDVSRSGLDWRNLLDYEWEFDRLDRGWGSVRLADVGAYEHIIASLLVKNPYIDIDQLRLLSTPFLFLTWYTEFTRADLREGRVFTVDSDSFWVERIIDSRKTSSLKGGIDFGYPDSPSYPGPGSSKGGIAFEEENPPFRITIDFTWGRYAPISYYLYEGVVSSGREDVLYLLIDPALPLPVVSILYSGPNIYIARLVDYYTR